MKYSLSIKFIRSALLLVCTILVVTSCTKSSDSAGSQGIIQVSLADATFESEETLGNRAATLTETNIQRNTVELNKDFLMVAELRPEDPASTSLKDGTRAALDTSALANNIRYRVLVYNQAGAFVTERDYIRGQESSTAALALDGGSTYTFVVVSFNQTTDLPATTPAVATRTLANSQITSGSGTTPFMYYKQNMTVTGNALNRLDIVLKHQKPQIATTINASQTGYNITAIDAVFTPHTAGTRANLSDGTYTQSGSVSSAQPNFTPSLGNQIITASAGINAPDNDVTVFTIRTITIGSITATDLIPFTNLNITRGVRYNLILNIVPTDAYITHQDRPAARINGVIWARHNVGVDISVDADAAPMTANRHGDFFQWGRLARSGASNATLANPFFASNAPANNTWNSGSEAVPIKTAADPCPTGYRIPTRAEFANLINAVTPSNTGPFVGGNSRFDSAKILTSRRNAQVRLTLPAQGRLTVSGGNNPPYANVGTEDRGATGYYHSSFSTNNPRTSVLTFTSTNLTQSNGGNNPSWKVLSHTIRCVGIE